MGCIFKKREIGSRGSNKEETSIVSVHAGKTVYVVWGKRGMYLAQKERGHRGWKRSDMNDILNDRKKVALRRNTVRKRELL